MLFKREASESSAWESAMLDGARETSGDFLEANTPLRGNAITSRNAETMAANGYARRLRFRIAMELSNLGGLKAVHLSQPAALILVAFWMGVNVFCGIAVLCSTDVCRSRALDGVALRSYAQQTI